MKKTMNQSEYSDKRRASGPQQTAGEAAGSDEDEEYELVKPRYLPKSVRLLIYLTVICLAAFVISMFGWKWMVDVFAFSKPDVEEEIIVTEGEPIDEIIDELCSKGFVEYRWLFSLFCRVTNAENKIGTGTYTLNHMYDYNALINGLRPSSENRAVVQLTFPEGWTCRKIFSVLEENGVCTAAALEQTSAGYMFEYPFLSEIPYGSVYRLEGYLFPDTYKFYVDDDPVRVLSKFLDNFEKKFNDSYIADIEKLNEMLRADMQANGFREDEINAARMDLNRVIIVASMIERETASVSESSSISSVIYNRLASKNYPLLQIDATLRYALDKWSEPLTAQDMLLDSGYNTSRRAGLPAGPISNPGIDSIRAALYPRDTEYYFYAYNPGTGLHHFSETSYDHDDFLRSLMGEAGNE